MRTHLGWGRSFLIVPMLMMSVQAWADTGQDAPAVPVTETGRPGLLKFFSGPDVDAAIFGKGGYGAKLPPLDKGTTDPVGNDTNDPVTADLLKRDTQNRDALLKRCGFVSAAGEKTTGLVLLGPLVGWVIEKVGEWFVSQYDYSVQQDVLKYGAKLAASAQPFNFFEYLDKAPFVNADDGTAVRAGDPQAVQDAAVRTICFRIAHRVPVDPNDPSKGTTLTMDFIGSISQAKAQQALLLIRPVRLFYSQASVPSADGTFLSTIKLDMDVVHLTASAGELKSGVLSAVLPTGGVHLQTDGNGKVVSPSSNKDAPPTPGFYTLYPKDAEAVPAPLLPWDLPAKNSKHNITIATSTVVEEGNVPWLLKNFAKILDDNKDGIAQGLVKAANSAIPIPTQ